VTSDHPQPIVLFTVPCVGGLHSLCRGASLLLLATTVDGRAAGWVPCACPCHQQKEVTPTAD
jgi:hypothetical protein